MANSIFSRFLIMTACICAWGDLAFAERKVAIVIGNSRYEHSQPLKNPVNDTKAISDLFKQLGYEVQLHLDVDRSGFTQALGDFHQVATSADAAIFYYAGHGVSVDGRNYLIPVDSNIQRVTDVKLGEAIDAELAIEQALADAKVKLVFLDACRDNPFADQIKRSLGTTRSTAVSSGLAEMKSGAGTLIAFSTAPGQVALDGNGDKSPFAEALLKHLAEPGLEIRLAMTKVRADVEAASDGNQTPWESTNLTGFYYLIDPQTKSEQPLAERIVNSKHDSGQNQAELEAETEFWRSIKDSDDLFLFETYLNNYPSGIFEPIANAKIKDIKKNNIKFYNNQKEDRKQFTGTENLGTAIDDGRANPQSMASGPVSVTRPPRQLPKHGEVSKTSDSSAKTNQKTATAKQLVEPIVNEDRANPKKPSPSLEKQKIGVDEARYLTKKVKRLDMGWTVPAGAVIVKKSIHSPSITIQYRGRFYRCIWMGGTGDFAGGRCICSMQ